MVINLKKGQGISLRKEAENLTKIRLGMGWDPANNGFDFDLDASAFLLAENGKCTREEDFVFYNNLSDNSGALEHSADDRTGGSSATGDDEYIIVDLSKLPEKYKKIVFVVTIDNYEERHQNFGMVENAYVRLLDETSDREIARYDLTEDLPIETSLTFCELVRQADGWHFETIGVGERIGLLSYLERYGLA